MSTPTEPGTTQLEDIFTAAHDLLPYVHAIDGISPEFLNTPLDLGGSATCRDCGNSQQALCKFHALVRELVELKKSNAALRNAVRVLTARDRATTQVQTGLCEAFKVLLDITDNKAPVEAAIAMLERGAKSAH